MPEIKSWPTGPHVSFFQQCQTSVEVGWARLETQRGWWRTGCAQESYVKELCGKVVCVTERECVCARVSVKSVACDNVVCVYGRVVCVKEACVCVCERVL